MCNTCDNSEAPVKRIEISVPPGDFWRSNSGADLPDQNNDHTEAISHNGPVVIGALDPTTGKILTVVGDMDLQGQLDPNSIVFSDAPAGVTTAWDSITNGYYLIGIIGTQRPMVAMPKTDTTKVFQVRRADGTTVVLNVDTLYQRVGVNTDDAKAALDVAGAVIHRQLTLTDIVANGAIGTALATVDAASVISLEQTTAGVTVTLPAPTNTQAGRLLLVENNGTTPITVDTTPITNGKMTAFVWSGIAWIPLAASGGGSGSTEDFWRSGTAANLLKPEGTNDTTENVARPGNVGIGIADPSTLAARLDVSGAEVLRPVALNNFAASGSVGAPAATVDIASALTINQTTTGRSLTLPNPTNTQAGRLLFVANRGTAQFFMAGQPIPAGTGIPFVWSGAAWIPLAGAAGLDFWRSGTAASLLIPDGVNDFTEVISHNGNLGIGIADPSLVASRLDVSGAEVLRPVALPNFTANGAIGTAAATVDVASTVTISQTTANIALTLPNPTNAQAGRILSVVNIGTAQVKVVNIGTAQVKVAGVYVNPGQGASWIWAGAWRLIGEQPDFTVVGASRAVTIGDYLKTLLAATAVTLTVPANLGYMVFRIRQSTNAGVITMAAGAGVTLVAPYGASTLGAAGDYKIVEIINNVAYVG